MPMKYDLILVGAGLFNAVIAQKAVEAGKKVLVIEKRNHVGGNCYTEEIAGIQVHRYGAHIFHTDSKQIWNYVNRFSEFNCFTNSPVAIYKNQLFNLPFNMNTFNRIWPDVITPEQAKKRIADQSAVMADKIPANLEEQGISLVGKDVFNLLVKGYTEKQWGKNCKELPPSIIKRLPVRFTYDNNYFTDKYQGIPVGGYTHMIQNMLKGADIILGTDFLEEPYRWKNMAEQIVYTGPIDQYFNYRFGELEYRSLRFETQVLDCENFQGNAVVNYTDMEIPYTRIIEHKHFECGTQPCTVITKEFPKCWKRGDEPYYPVTDSINNELYTKYQELASREAAVIFGGRLGMYRYFDMDDTIDAAFSVFRTIEKSFFLS